MLMAVLRLAGVREGGACRTSNQQITRRPLAVATSDTDARLSVPASGSATLTLLGAAGHAEA